MKAIVCPKYGPPDVLQLKEVEKPVPKNNELLIRVFTVLVGMEDSMQRMGKPYFARFFVGLTKPRKQILGTEFCGEIETVGRDVRQFNKGDIVFGATGVRFGCYAEYMCMPDDGFLNKKGFYLTTYPMLSILFKTFWTSMFNSKKVVFSATGLKPVSERLAFLKELIKLFNEGKLKTIIDQSFQLEQMTEAHRYVEKGFERGNVIVTI